MIPMGEAAWSLVVQCMPDDAVPRSEHGRRELLAWLRAGGSWEQARSINWDLEPHSWAMKHEIECAAMAAGGGATTEAAE